MMIPGLMGALACAWLVSSVLLIYWTGAHAWDDGAITIAFARTLADTGSFALTPVSERVEGSSSLLFCVLISLLTRWDAWGFTAQVHLAQGLAMGFAVLTAALTYRALAEHVPDRRWRALLATLMLFLPTFQRELMNGMEMTLLAALMVAHVLTLTSRRWWSHAIIAALLATRFEAAVYVGGALVLMWWWHAELRPTLQTKLASTALVLAALTAWRQAYFGQWMPNTVYAKAHPPYSGTDLVSALVKKLGGPIELLDVTLPMWLAVVVLLTFRPMSWTPRQRHLAALLLTMTATSVLIGRNWGYSGRMYIAFMPLGLLFLAACMSECRMHTRLVGGMLALVLMGTIWSNRALTEENLRTALVGGHLQQRLPAALDAVVARHPKQIHADDVTPAYYRETGLTIDRLRSELGLSHITFMTPDVGGLALCCPQIRVVDLGLLTNRTLAKQGYRALPQVLRTEQPDVIEVHEPWSSASGLYGLPALREQYFPVAYQRVLIWVHQRHRHAFAGMANHRLSRLPLGDLPKLDAVDRQAVQTIAGTVITAVDHPPAGDTHALASVTP